MPRRRLHKNLTRSAYRGQHVSVASAGDCLDPLRDGAETTETLEPRRALCGGSAGLNTLLRIQGDLRTLPVDGRRAKRHTLAVVGTGQLVAAGAPSGARPGDRSTRALSADQTIFTGRSVTTPQTDPFTGRSLKTGGRRRRTIEIRIARRAHRSDPGHAFPSPRIADGRSTTARLWRLTRDALNRHGMTRGGRRLAAQARAAVGDTRVCEGRQLTDYAGALFATLVQRALLILAATHKADAVEADFPVRARIAGRARDTSLTGRWALRFEVGVPPLARQEQGRTQKHRPSSRKYAGQRSHSPRIARP